MQPFHYFGSGPYCYANSIAMMLGVDAPSLSVIEFATGSPFGMQMVDESLMYFDPRGWTPHAGVDAALEVIGWTSSVANPADEPEALEALRAALEDGPVYVGPVEMGHLRYQPGRTGPVGADHFLVVLAIEGDQVRVHDPEGHPHATLPVSDFMAAWRADTVDYATPFTLRTRFEKIREVHPIDSLRAALPAGVDWLARGQEGAQTPGPLANAPAAERLADLIAAGCGTALREHLIHFAVRVGARRLTDGSAGLARIGLDRAAGIMAHQARIVGGLQHPLVVGDDATAAARLRPLASTYAALHAALLD